MKKLKLIMILFLILGASFVISITPQGSFDYKNYYSLYNALDVNSSRFCLNGDCIITWGTLGNNTWWPITGYIINNSGSLNINETKLNQTIINLDTNTQWLLDNYYLYNNSGTLTLNETKLNQTIINLDTNTQWLITGYIINDNGSLNINETMLNITIDNRSKMNALWTNIGTQIIPKLGYIDINISGTYYGNNFSSNSPLRLQTGGNTRFFIDDIIGNIGIGTENPLSPLDVRDNNKVPGAGFVSQIHADDEFPFGFGYFNDMYNSTDYNKAFTYYLRNNGTFTQTAPINQQFAIGDYTNIKVALNNNNLISNVSINVTSGNDICIEDGNCLSDITFGAKWPITEYIINDSGSLNINETLLNQTIIDLSISSFGNNVIIVDKSITIDNPTRRQFTTIKAAVFYAKNQIRNSSNRWLVLINPGTYIEDAGVWIDSVNESAIVVPNYVYLKGREKSSVRITYNYVGNEQMALFSAVQEGDKNAALESHIGFSDLTIFNIRGDAIQSDSFIKKPDYPEFRLYVDNVKIINSSTGIKIEERNTAGYVYDIYLKNCNEGLSIDDGKMFADNIIIRQAGNTKLTAGVHVDDGKGKIQVVGLDIGVDYIGGLDRAYTHGILIEDRAEAHIYDGRTDNTDNAIYLTEDGEFKGWNIKLHDSYFYDVYVSDPSNCVIKIYGGELDGPLYINGGSDLTLSSVELDSDKYQAHSINWLSSGKLKILMSNIKSFGENSTTTIEYYPLYISAIPSSAIIAGNVFRYDDDNTLPKYLLYSASSVNVDLANNFMFGNGMNSNIKTSSSIKKVGGTTDYYSTIQDGINSASSGNVVEIRGGVYNENVVLKSNVNLVGNGHSRDTIIQSNTGTVLTFGGGTSSVKNLMLKSEPTTSGVTLININNDGIYKFTDCEFELFPNNTYSTLINLTNGSLTPNICNFYYKQSGVTAGSNAQKIFNINGNSKFTIFNSQINIDINDNNDNITAIYIQSTTDENLLMNGLLRVNILNNGYSGVVKGVELVSNAKKNVQGNSIKIKGSNVGTGYVYYVDSNLISGEIHSTANRIEINDLTDKYWAFANTNDVISSRFDDMNINVNISKSGNGNITWVSSDEEGNLFINKDLYATYIEFDDASNTYFGKEKTYSDYFAIVNDYTNIWLGHSNDKFIWINFDVDADVGFGPLGDTDLYIYDGFEATILNQDGSDFRIDVEGNTNKCIVEDSFQADNYYSGDGSKGITQTISVRKGDDTGACDIIIKDGLITSTTC